MVRITFIVDRDVVEENEPARRAKAKKEEEAFISDVQVKTQVDLHTVAAEGCCSHAPSQIHKY